MAPFDSLPITIGIVLAAGAGSRMGGNKARLLIGGEPLAVLHATRLREAGCTEVILVTRPEVAPLFAEERRLRAVVSTAEDQAGSLLVGLEAAGIDGTPDAIVVITPVDALPPRAETITRLVAAVVAGVDAATPRHAGRGGHPVVARAHVLTGRATASVAGERPDGLPCYLHGGLPLRDVLAALGVRRLGVDVDDPAIGSDLDTPDDVRQLTGASPRFYG